MFITFEGIDGCGKSTQITLLHKRLLDEGQNVFYTKEPGDKTVGSNIGYGVRQLLFFDPTSKAMHPGVNDLLFLADHVQTAGDVAAALKRGQVVICDRYADSQFAYSASQGKASPEWAQRYYRELFGTVPDLTFLFVVRGKAASIRRQPKFAQPNIQVGEDISWALLRAQIRRGVEAGKQDGKAWNDVDQQRVIQEAYLVHLQRFHPHRTQLIDIWEETSKEQIAEAVWFHTSRLLGKATANGG